MGKQDMRCEQKERLEKLLVRGLVSRCVEIGGLENFWKLQWRTGEGLESLQLLALQNLFHLLFCECFILNESFGQKFKLVALLSQDVGCPATGFLDETTHFVFDLLLGLRGKAVVVASQIDVTKLRGVSEAGDQCECGFGGALNVLEIVSTEVDTR